MTTQTNTTPGGLSPRLEIASRVLAGIVSDHSVRSTQQAELALAAADALLAADAGSSPEQRILDLEAERNALRGDLNRATARLAEGVSRLEAELARVTRDLDEEEATSDYLRHELGVRNTEVDLLHGQIASAENTLADVRAQLASALAPIPEEEGLEELDYAALEWCHMPDHNPIARHALASHARVKARKAREEGGAK